MHIYKTVSKCFVHYISLDSGIETDTMPTAQRNDMNFYFDTKLNSHKQ